MRQQSEVTPPHRRARLCPAPALVSLVLATSTAMASLAFAAPQGGIVRGGQVTIETAGARTLVRQSSDRAIIDWRGFDLKPTESLRFVQPGRGSATLNRVGPGGPSRIDGRIDANGQVFIANPAGVIFGARAQVNVAGLLVTSADLDNRDFLDGRLTFSKPGLDTATVANQGTLNATDAGFIALVAPRVFNDGLITARLGRVALASGERFAVDLTGDQLIRFTVPARQALVLDNGGTLQADGGSVSLSAAAARHVVDSVVNLDGVIRADRVAQHDGRIILGAPDSIARVGGRLQAGGGQIDLRARSLEVHGARLDVSAPRGGGRLHVGGAWQGKGPGPHAEQVSVSVDSVLDADATARGDGGEVVVWSDGATRFAGLIKARGGPDGGDGGRVEVSGRRTLGFSGTVDSGATAGTAGRLLLDPLDIAIHPGDAGVIGRVLRTGTSVTLLAERDIVVNAPIDGRGNRSGGGLTLDAGRNLVIHDFIVTQNGAVDLVARTGVIDFVADTAVVTGSAPIRISAAGRLTTGALASTAFMTLRSTGGPVRITAPIDAAAGDLLVEAAGDIQVEAPILNLQTGADVTLSAGGNLSVAAQIGAGNTAVPGGAVTLRAGGNVNVRDAVVTRDGAIDITAGAGVAFTGAGAAFAGSAAIEIRAGTALIAGSTVTGGPVRLRSDVGAVSLGAAIEAANGDLDVIAATDIRVYAPIVNLRNGSSVVLQAGRDIDLEAPVNGVDATVPGGRVVLGAGGDIRIAESVATTNGAIVIDAGGFLEQAGDAVLSTGSGPIDITTTGQLYSGALLSNASIALRSTAGSIVLGGLVPENAGDLSVTAAGDVRVEHALANLRSGADLAIRSGGDLVVAAPIEGRGASEAGSASLSASGTLVLAQFIATDLASIDLAAGERLAVTASGGVYAASAPVHLTAGGDLELNGPVFSRVAIDLAAETGSVTLHSGFAPGGSLTVQAARDIQVNAPVTSLANGQPLRLLGGGDIRLDAAIDGRNGAHGGSVTIDAGRQLVVNAPIATLDGAIDLVAGTDAQFSGSAGLFAGTAPIRVSSAGNLTAGPASTHGSLTFESRSGSIRANGVLSAGRIHLEAARDLRIGASAVARSALIGRAGGNLTVAHAIQGDDVSLRAGGTLDGEARVVAGSGLSASGRHITGSGGLYSGGRLSVRSTESYAARGLSAGSSLSVSSGGMLHVAQDLGGFGGSVVLSAGQDLQLDAAIADLGGAVSLSAAGDVHIDNRIDGIAGGVRIDAGRDVIINQDIVTDDAPIDITAGTTILHRDTGLDSYGAPQTAQLRAGSASIIETVNADLSVGSMVTSGAIRLTSTGGDINVDVPIYETSGATRLDAAGDININQVIANATTGADLDLVAGGDIRIAAKVGPWDRNDATFPVAGRTALSGGSVRMLAAGDILIGAEIATFKDVLPGPVAELSLVSTGGAVGFTAPDLRVMSDFGDITVSSFADLANGPALPDVNATPTTGFYTSGRLALQSTGGDVTIDRLIPKETGAVLIDAFDQVRVNQRIYTDNGNITILAGAGGLLQNPAIDPHPDPDFNTDVISDINAQDGDILIRTEGDVLPTVLRTKSLLTIVSTAGSIIGGRVLASGSVFNDPDGSFPQIVELAGFAGIDDFSAGSAREIAALSFAGSIDRLRFGVPHTLLLVAGEDIVQPTSNLGADARLFAGRDLLLPDLQFHSLQSAAGRDINIGATMHPVLGQALTLGAGSDPFASITGTRIADIEVPARAGPTGPGDITIGTNPTTDILWLAGIGGLTADASGDIRLPRTHVSFDLAEIPDTIDPRQLEQPLTLAADGNVSIEQIETNGPVAITSTGGDLSIGATIGAHVSLETPERFLWNPTDLGVASLLLAADNGNIDMHEARAEGDIRIMAPNGQITFIGGQNGIEAGGARSVTDSDGIVITDTIDPVEVARLPDTTDAGAPVSAGPTLAGPGAPPIPGALPPLGPPGVSVAALSASGVSVAIADPAAHGVAQAGPGVVQTGRPAGPGGIDVSGSAAPSPAAGMVPGGDFGEIFVVGTGSAGGDFTDPVRVDARREETPTTADQETRTTAEATDVADIAEPGVEIVEAIAPAQDATEVSAPPATGQNSEVIDGDGTSATAASAPAEADHGAADESLALVVPGGESPADDDEDEEEKTRVEVSGEQPVPWTVLVFSGGRGDARERDFGYRLPFEDGRVRP